ncbi:preprotein translocase subunit YajC [Enterococcus sp. LJL128]|uniref:preprotein translocase subunit YajC n=1 Tax=Enterococcus sp. LJL51 TaxID=3416656 RepID=UPI003CF7CCDF
MGGGFSMILMLVVLGGMMFFMTRSQKKQQKERQDLLGSMKIGDSIVTIGGLHGVVSEFDDVNRTVFVDCEGIILEFDRQAIRTVKPNITADAPMVDVVEETTEIDLDKHEPSVDEAPKETETKE